MNFFSPYNHQIGELCQQYKVNQLFAFGSVLTDNFNEESDVDLIVDFKRMPQKIYSDNYYNFKFSLEDMFNRPIDLLEYKAIKNPYFLENINNNKKMIYAN